MTLSVFDDRDRLEQEIKDLNDENEILSILEQKESKQIEILLAQIEKMKCCQNCYKGGTCLDYDCIHNNYKNWEFSK